MNRNTQEGHRALFYTRDSGGKHEQTPGQYVAWARREATELGLAFTGTPEDIQEMARRDEFVRGDLFLDYEVKGNELIRRGLDALFARIRSDDTVTRLFIPRRDRLARPKNPIDGERLETSLRVLGVSIQYSDKILPPLQIGRRQDIGEVVTSIIEFEGAGKFRRELAEKVIAAQLELSQQGFSSGGRPPFYMRRWLVDPAGHPVRELAEGEISRRKGYHVAWLPGPDRDVELALRIRQMLISLSPCQIARILTDEGIPSPDAGRSRKKNGVKYCIRPEWISNTVSAVGRCAYLTGLAQRGRRSMGDELRFTPNGPRELQESDYRDVEQQKTKVVVNSESNLVVAKARFAPIVDEDSHRQLIEKLDQRGLSQRGKPRSKNPDNNPLGTRIFDMNCTWGMYRVPYGKTFRYRCSAYMQSHGQRCDHNQVDGPRAAAFVLAAIQQRVIPTQVQNMIRERLEQLAAAENQRNQSVDEVKSLSNRLLDIRGDLASVEKNLARASDEAFQAILKEFNRLKTEEKGAATRLQFAEQNRRALPTANQQVQACIDSLVHLQGLVQNAESFAAIRELFNTVDAKLFLRFERCYTGKQRKNGAEFSNRVVGGEITLGNQPAPIEIYQGPTNRSVLDGPAGSCTPSPLAKNVLFSEKEGDPLGNVSRGDRI